MREWLKDCDAHGCLPQSAQTYCPRRLLFIEADKADSNNARCRLVNRSELPLRSAEIQYVALSHPWGNSEISEPFKATESNIDQLMQGIDAEELPQTLRDAVNITLKLGHQYMWIDSLCIRQKSGDDSGDFLEEAKYMQEIYSSAYCVIAASSATDMDSGLLPVRDQHTIKWSPKNDPTSAYYISSAVDDFEADVEKGPLSGRGWVFQERALARRTIFFTDNQTYFECGQGIRCETLTKLKK